MTALAAVFLLAPTLPTADPVADAPRPVPLTRPEMKQALEDMKVRRPRIPLPELTAAEKAGDREAGYEGRLRCLYLPPGEGRGGGFGLGREADPKMSLDYRFKTAAVLDRVPGQQLPVLTGPPGEQARGRGPERRRDRGPGR